MTSTWCARLHTESPKGAVLVAAGDEPSVPTEASGSAPAPCVFVVAGPIVREDLPGLCERAREFLERCTDDVVACDVAAITGPDAVTLDALARLQLLARQSGRHVRLRNVTDELRCLLDLAGLCEVVPTDGA